MGVLYFSELDPASAAWSDSTEYFRKSTSLLNKFFKIKKSPLLSLKTFQPLKSIIDSLYVVETYRLNLKVSTASTTTNYLKIEIFIHKKANNLLFK